MLANQVRFAPIDQNADPTITGFGNDNWDGYVADRQRVLDFMREQKPSNPIVITGDAHVHSVRNVPPRLRELRRHAGGDRVHRHLDQHATGTRTQPQSRRPSFDDDTENPHRLFQTQPARLRAAST